MKTLFLLRHAKSSWKDDTLPDFERPLNSRGRRTTKTLSTLFTSEKVKPDLILSSCAVRARETIEPIVELAKLRSELRFDERIYEATADRLFEVILQIEKSRRTVLLVGHNPGLEELLTVFTGQSETMPTGALARISFDNSAWESIEAQTGMLEWVVRPKELEKRED
jgi:phosphohistidine phosphatase